jgi:hypothetical protein
VAPELAPPDDPPSPEPFVELLLPLHPIPIATATESPKSALSTRIVNLPLSEAAMERLVADARSCVAAVAGV